MVLPDKEASAIAFENSDAEATVLTSERISTGVPSTSTVCGAGVLAFRFAIPPETEISLDGP